MPSPLCSHTDGAGPAERMKLPKRTQIRDAQVKTTAAGSPFIRKLNRHPERCKANQRDAKTALEITDGDFILHDFFF